MDELLENSDLAIDDFCLVFESERVEHILFDLLTLGLFSVLEKILL